MVQLTGATGIVRKVVLAELRRPETLGVERVLALLRGKNPEQTDAGLRNEVLGSPCFAAVAPGFENWIEAVADGFRSMCRSFLWLGIGCLKDAILLPRRTYRTN